MKNTDKDFPLSVSSLLVMMNTRKLKGAATGMAIAERSGLHESAVYNITSRLMKRGFMLSHRRERVGNFTRYELTPEGNAYLDAVRKLLK